VVLAPLKELENRGVAILVCGTCLDYFNKKADLRVGKVSNMFTILETLSRAGQRDRTLVPFGFQTTIFLFESLKGLTCRSGSAGRRSC